MLEEMEKEVRRYKLKLQKYKKKTKEFEIQLFVQKSRI